MTLTKLIAFFKKKSAHFEQVYSASYIFYKFMKINKNNNNKNFEKNMYNISILLHILNK